MGNKRVRVLAACSAVSALLIVGVLGIALQRSPETTAAMAAGCLDRPALAQFQLARSMDDLLAVFGPPDSPCRPLVVEALTATQHADFAALMPGYVVFFITAALGLAGFRSRWTWLAVIATVVAALANVFEDTVQLRIIGSVEDASGLLVPLEIGSLTKFIAFAACSAAFAGWALRRPDKKWIVGIAGLLPLPATIAGGLDPQRWGFAMAITFFVFAAALFGTVALVAVFPQRAKGSESSVQTASAH